MNINEMMGASDEKPLDRLVTDGGFCRIFRTIGCIGDSLSSGEFESVDENGVKHYNDLMEYSWGQQLARMAGCKVYNFSRGGMTADWYLDSYAGENGFWDPEKACQAYIIALGVNDIINLDKPIGTTADIDIVDYRNNKDTFAGKYAEIIARYKEISPRAKFFFVTMPQYEYESAERSGKRDAHASLLYRLTDCFANSYVIDLRKYAPVYDMEFRKMFYLGGHMNPCGYLLTAKMIASYMDYIIRHNMEDFHEVGFIGTDLHYLCK